MRKNYKHQCDITLNTDKIKHLKLFLVHQINTAYSRENTNLYGWKMLHNQNQNQATLEVNIL